VSIGSILNIARSGLDASQTAIQTVSHNVANVNTPGYSEQQAVLVEAEPTPSSVGLLGNGVSVQQIKSYFDQNLQDAITNKNSDVQEQQVYEQYLTQIQSVFNEDNSNLSTNITTFFNDWSTLSTDPTSTSDKQTVAADGKTLCTTFNTMYSDLTNLQSDLNGEVTSQISDINGITSQIASLNKLVSQSAGGSSQANDYIDQRNQLLQQLSGYMNISYFTDSGTNMVTVLTSKGSSLVDGAVSYNLTGNQQASTGMTGVSWQGPSGDSQDITGQITGGSLGAVITTRDATIPGYLSNLNALAQSITQNVNYFHEQGDGGAGVPFFQTGDTSNCAQGISLAGQIEGASGTVQTQNIMASSSSTDTTDNDVAARIASLANESILGEGTITSATFGSDTSALDLSGDLVVNGTDVSVASTDTLTQIADNISASDAGVSASVVPVSGGYKVVLAAQAGAQNISVADGSLSTPSTGTSSITQSLGLSGSTWVNYEAAVVSGVGQATTSATDLATYNQNALTSLQQQQSQESGVSIDEEMSNLIMYQNAYQASARLYTVAQAMVDSLLQSVGVTTT
jgi:flagellar hook-associated protein 1 FlgK